MLASPLAIRGALALLIATSFVRGTSAQQLTSTLISDVFSKPVMLTSPPNDDRLFVCEQHTGLIRIYDAGVVLPTPFLSLAGLVTTGSEEGLLGLAFHPDYASNGFFYVSYTDATHASVVRRYTVSVGDPNVADPASFVVVFGPLVHSSAFNHSGCLQFGPDGKLYYGMGDGLPPQDVANRAQNLGLYFGKILRLDVDLPFPHVPVDNPFVADPSALDLIWAYGLRNPWLFSFDSQTGDLWIGDVGEMAHEEIDFQPAASNGGENYGWNCFEALACTGYPHSGCSCASPTLVAPVHDYPHDGRCAVVAGHLYRGQFMPNMVGRYVFTDYCVKDIWSFAWNGVAVSDLVNHGSANVGFTRPASLSADANGELYLLDSFDGQIFRLEEVCTPVTQNYCVTTPNSNGAGAVMGHLGSTSVTANDLVLTTTGASTTQPGVYFYGPGQIQIPFGNGFRCVGAAGLGVFRLNPAMPTDASGNIQRPLDLTVPPAGSGPGEIQPGDTWNFQFWFRDPMAGGAGFDLSDALEAAFCP